MRQLESALEERSDARDDAEAGLDAARAEAERLLADARRPGADAGRRRRAAVLAEAEAEATAIRAAGEADGARSFASAWPPQRDELVAELTALVLPREA